MLNFLRRLRQNNMNSKYLKYAIGEIVLVVIGILIALSINNWNQGRLEKIEEKKLLNNIKVDFEEAVSTFRSLNNRRDESIQNFSKLIEVAIDNNYEQEVMIDTLLGKTIFTPTYNGKLSALSIVINSGKINLLSSDTLKSLLLKWPQKVDDMVEGEIDAKKLIYDTWLPFVSSYAAANDFFSTKELRMVLPFEKRKTMVEKDYQGMLADRKFQNTITMLELLFIIGKKETEELIGFAEEIIALIELQVKD